MSAQHTPGMQCVECEGFCLIAQTSACPKCGNDDLDREENPADGVQCIACGHAWVEAPLEPAPARTGQGGAGRGQGRKRLDPSQRSVNGSVRLTPAQWARFDELGGLKWLREKLDERPRIR